MLFAGVFIGQITLRFLTAMLVLRHFALISGAVSKLVAINSLKLILINHASLMRILNPSSKDLFSVLCAAIYTYCSELSYT